MNVIRCPDCGRSYETTKAILDAGGSVYQLGLALMGCCFCGCELGNVAKIWRAKGEK